MAQKTKKTKKKRTDVKNKYHISLNSIKRSTNLKKNNAKSVAEQIYRIGNNNNYGEVVVVTLDIRKSSIVLVNLEDFEEYSAVITDYVCYVLKTCQSDDFPCMVEVKNDDGKMTQQECGWFDKFTGDGVIVFWRLPGEPELDEKYYELSRNVDYERKLEEYYTKWNATIRGAIEFAIRVTEQFLENVIPDIKKTCGLLPADFGISVGIDAGTCLLTELKASDKFSERCTRFGLKCREKPIVSPNVTAIGRAIIGATRMVSQAKPYEILINSYPGAKIKAAIDDSKDKSCQGVQFSLEPTCVSTKEYSPVEVYRVISGRLEQIKSTKTFCAIKKEFSEKEIAKDSKYIVTNSEKEGNE